MVSKVHDSLASKEGYFNILDIKLNLNCEGDILNQGTFTNKGNIALGEASIESNTLINTEFSPVGLSFGTLVPIINLKVNINNGLLATPIGMFTDIYINEGTSLWTTPISFRSEMTQNSNQSWNIGYGFYSKFNSALGISGSMGELYNFYVASPKFQSAVPLSLTGLNIKNQGKIGMTTSIGIEIDKQSGSTINQGIFLNGDGIGSNIIFGTGKNATIYYDGTNLIYDSQFTGTGNHIFNGGNVDITNNLQHNGLNAGFYGTLAIAQQNITGSRGGNVALANLLTALANLGLITDSTI